MAQALRKRGEIEAKYKWDLTHIFATDEAWEQAYAKTMEDVQQAAAFDGKVAENPKGAIRAGAV